MFSKIQTIFSIIFSAIFHYTSFLFPRDIHRWSFVGWHIGNESEIFADNTKYLFLYTAQNQKNIRAIWIAKDETLAQTLRDAGYESYCQKSLKGAWHMLRSGTVCIDAFFQRQNYRWTGGTRLVQLLHGKGMKKYGYAQKPAQKQHYIFSTSPLVTKMLPPIFVQDTPVIEAGYSRDDVFFTEIPGSTIGVDMRVVSILADTSYTQRFLYAPTFRRSMTDFDLEKKLNLTELSQWLMKKNAVLLLSLHPKYRTQTRALSYPNIHFISDSDMYPLLPNIDVLITDYSSIFTDFLLLNKPIIFYPFDLETYRKEEGLYFEDYEAATPGTKIYSAEELIPALEQNIAGDPYQAERDTVCKEYHTYTNGGASERIFKALTE